MITYRQLRDTAWSPHRGSIHLDIGQAIDPETITDENNKDTWYVAIGLRNRSREFILRHCGEPDLSRK